jgi:endonuclease/exonuclease/phosphatase family metal-dependent hydrolase
MLTVNQNQSTHGHQQPENNQREAGVQSVPIRLLSHNIRYAATNLDKGEKPWPMRAPQLIAELRFHTITAPESFICLQEVLHKQLIDIVRGLNETSSNAKSSEWAFLGVGRDDGKQAGEYCPILYRPAVWNLIESRTIWLSQTPDRPSRGWDAACNRLLTIGIFEHRQSRRRVVAMNTHLDHVGVEARANSAKLIIQEILKASKGNDMPTFLAGDFNSEENQEAYLALSAGDSPVQDLQGLVPEKRRYGYRETFTGFDSWTGSSVRIDFLFLGKYSPWKVLTYAVLENKFDGLYVSDHRAVVADVIIS